MESVRCSTCEKRQGTCLCSGCKKHFCMQDFKSHRNGLANEMDSIISDRDSVQDKINKSSENLVDNSPLLLKITEWEEETVKKVRKTAELVRQQVTKLHESKQGEIKILLDKISKELIEMKETEDFVEPDLTRLRQNIQQLNQDLNLLNQPNTIQLCIEESNKINWNQLIYVQERSKSTNNDTKDTRSSRMIANSRPRHSSMWDDDIETNNIFDKPVKRSSLFKRNFRNNQTGTSTNSTNNMNGNFLSSRNRQASSLLCNELQDHDISWNSPPSPAYVDVDEDW